MEGLISSKINPETIVEAIDALRARKARPDKTRICYHLERKYGYSRDSVLSQLSNLVTSGKILKVKYKDYYSYRNPAAKKSGGKKKLLTTKQKGLSVINSNTSETKQLIGDLINSLQLSSISTRSTSETATTKSISSRLTSNSKIPSSSMLMSDKGTVSRSSSSIGDLLMVNSLFNCDDTNSSGKGLICLNTVGFNSVEEINIDREKSPANDSDYHDNSPDYQDNLSQRNGLKYVSKNKKLPTNSLGNDIASSSRKTEELPLQRARPVSQRKKIKKSLGPDFLDPSDLGYGYLKDTYEPKCYYCDYPVTSARSDKHLTCCKCNLKAHRRCLIPEAENMDIPEDEWLCEKCATICLYCGLSTETEPMMSCTKCDTPFHILCIQLYSDQLKAPYTCLQCVDSSGVNDVRDLAKENNNNNNRMNRFNSSSSISVNSNDANDLINKKLATDKPATKLNTVSTVSPIKNQVNNGTLMNNNSNNNSNNSSNDNFHSFISAKLAKIIKSFSIDPDPKNWTPSDVETYVREIGFPEQAPLFKEQLIDGRSLLLLRRMDVLRGLSIKLGPALKIYAHINQLQGSDLPLIENDLPKSQSSSKLNQF